MTIAGRLLAAAACAAASAAGAADPTWTAGAGLRVRQLTEFNAAGSRIVRETGPMLRAHVGARLPLAGGGSLATEFAFSAGDLDYAGRTNPAPGVPIDTRSRNRDLEAALRWQPWAPAGWGQAGLGLRWLSQRRTILSTPVASGLQETSRLWMPGLTWQSPAWAVGQGWEVRLDAEAWFSVSHRLRVDFGGVFDEASFGAGRRHDLVLRANLAAAGSPWAWSLEWAGARQRASRATSLTRGGAVVGTVTHPRIAIDDVTLRLSRSF